MIRNQHFRKLLILIALATPAWAGIVDDVRVALARDNFSTADAYLNSYRARKGVTPEYVEAYSWMGRAALDAHQYDQAEAYAKQTRILAQEQLKLRPLDSEPHLPIALGAAFEIQSQTLAARGQRTQAMAVLQTALKTYGTTSIRERLQKNLNLLSFEGRPAPALRGEQFLGSKPPALAALKGSPVLLFFWAHWCGDCKAEVPIITQLRSEFAPKGLTVLGPTRLYGYTAQVQNAAPSAELAYIDAVRHRFYGGLLDMPVPISTYNFDVYGASTTPTLVLLDRAGKVAMYHPGALAYEQLKAEIEKVVR
ncbi:MAG TPA: TlpA family protein disulfide reductase [Candidatus Dormibacteraeota bacterium]|jgi:thiol-disulfide isomerase/thioredoxin|nr:TlpA family protein disulfide reductase [Candidatus Dormibacteraeota bacterium]